MIYKRSQMPRDSFATCYFGHGGVIGTKHFWSSWGYNFLSFKGITLKLIQATILHSWNRRFVGRESEWPIKKSKLPKTSPPRELKKYFAQI